MVRIRHRVDDDLDGLSLNGELVDAIVRHCVAALPNEGCGLLAGRRARASLVADRFYPGTNRLASPSRFAMDPAEVMAALTAIDRDGHRLAAVVHSHPTTEAVPSRTDLREAYYPEALLLIVSLAGETPRLRAWRPPLGDEDQSTVVELPIWVSPPR